MRTYSVRAGVTFATLDPPTVLRLTASASKALYLLRASLTAPALGAAITDETRTRAVIQRATSTGTKPAGISFRSFSQVRSATPATSLTITKPAGVVEGDVMVAFIAIDVDVAITPPAGWSTLAGGGAIDGNILLSQGVYRKVAGPAEPADYTWSFAPSFSNVAGRILAYIGVDPNNPVESSNVNTGNDASPVGLSLTPATANTMLVGGAAAWAPLASFTTPAGMTERAEQLLTPSNNDADQAIAAAETPTGTRTWTIPGAAEWMVNMLLLREKTVLPERHMPGDAAAQFVAVAGPFTTEPAFAGDPIVDEGFRWRDGFLWVPSQEQEVWVPPSGHRVIRLTGGFPIGEQVLVNAVVAELG